MIIFFFKFISIDKRNDIICENLKNDNGKTNDIAYETDRDFLKTTTSNYKKTTEENRIADALSLFLFSVRRRFWIFSRSILIRTLKPNR